MEQEQFLFLAVNLYITTSGTGYDELKVIENPVASVFFIEIVNFFSVMGLFLMAIFLVNSSGNDFNEGSYRKRIAMDRDTDVREYYCIFTENIDFKPSELAFDDAMQK